MSTRAGVVRRAVHLTRRGFATVDGVNALTASGGTTTTIVDTANLPPTGQATNYYRNWYVYRPNANNTEDVKRIVGSSAYEGSTQTLTVTPAYTEAPLAGTDDGTYLLLRDDPDTWNSALNEALREMLAFPNHHEWSPTSDTQRIYTIGSAPLDGITSVTRLSQLWGLQYHDENETANEEDWRDWQGGSRRWEPFEDNGTFYIDFGRGQVPDSTMQMRFIVMEPYSTLAAEDTTSNVDELWAAYASILVMADWLGDPDNLSDAWNVLARKFRPRYHARRRAQLGLYAYSQVQRHSTRPGGAPVGGRMGR